jgi:transposase-like protein
MTESANPPAEATGGECPRRHRMTAAEKPAITAEALAPGANASEVARRHGVNPATIFRLAAEGAQRRGEAAQNGSGCVSNRSRAADATAAPAPAAKRLCRPHRALSRLCWRAPRCASRRAGKRFLPWLARFWSTRHEMMMPRLKGPLCKTPGSEICEMLPYSLP